MSRAAASAAGAEAEGGDDFAVDPLVDRLGRFADRFPGMLRRLGNFETRLFEERLGTVRQPVYVTGLARSGSTVLLELLAWQPGVVTHRYRDFPLLQVPILWNRFLDYAARNPGAPRQRAHRDGILVTRESPEAFEEVLWMAFFDGLHDPGQSSVLTQADRSPLFDRFYRDHIRKLLLLRGGSRYVSKGNYNVTRLDYILSLFPDARFVVPIREPVWHVASLLKQHRLFIEALRRNPLARDHLRRAGHFEFGPDRSPVSVTARTAREVLECWQDGREVEGWARCWSSVYDHVLTALETQPKLAEATLVVPYEALCGTPAVATELLYAHCGFEPRAELLERATARLRFPAYYEPDFSAAERDVITRHTRSTAERVVAYVAEVTPRLAASAGEVPARAL